MVHVKCPFSPMWCPNGWECFVLQITPHFLFSFNYVCTDFWNIRCKRNKWAEHERTMTLCFHCSSTSLPAVCLIGGWDPVPGRHLDWWKQCGGSQGRSCSCCSSDHLASPHIHSAPRQLPGEHARHCHSTHQWVELVLVISPWPLIYCIGGKITS